MSSKKHLKRIIIPKNLENREFYFRDSFLGEKFINGDVVPRKDEPFITGFRQPIDFKVKRLMKIEPERTPSKLSLKIWLSDPYISARDVSAMITAALRMTRKEYKMTFDGKSRIEVYIEDADKLYPAINIESLYVILEDSFKHKDVDTAFTLTVAPVREEVDFTPGDWKSGTEHEIEELLREELTINDAGFDETADFEEDF